jgi:predicted NACHT family NTPase
VQDKDMAEGLVYPKLERIRDISAQIAAKVAQCAIDEVSSDGPHPDTLTFFLKNK